MKGKVFTERLGERRDHTRLFLKDPLSLLRRNYEEHGEVFQLRVFGVPNVFMVGPEAARFVLQDMTDSFSAREGNLQVAQNLFGTSMLFQDGDVHRELREAMMPALHSSSIQHYLNTMIEIIKWELKSWEFAREVNVYRRVQRITLEVVLRTLLGTSLGDKHTYVQSNIDDLARGLYANNPIGLPWTWYGKGVQARHRLQQAFAPLINRYRAVPSDDQNLMSLLVSRVTLNGRPLTDEEVMDQVNTFLFAGYDTSSSLIAWATWHVLRHPGVHTRLLQEIRGAGALNELTIAKVRRLKYLDCVVKETERLCPPVYFIPRMAMQDISYKQYVIPQGWLVNIVPLLSHRLPGLFLDPDRYDPERFLPPREEHKRTPLSLIGFGAGPKACIGYAFAQLEIKLFLLMAFAMYGMTLRTKDLVAGWVPSLHPRNGPVITVTHA